MTRVFVLTVMLVSVLVAEAAGKAAKKCPSMKNKLIQGIKKYETQCPASTQSKLLRFPEKLSTANYVLLRPDMSLVREELSVCTWLKKRLDQSKKGLPWFSYAVAGADNTILLKAAVHLALIASGNYFNMPYKAEIMRDEWYHMCFTWKSGRADFYVNGVWVYIGGVQPKGQIPLRGTLVLGQEQDSPGGGFDINDVYAGDMYQMNVFKKKLSLEEVTEMYYNGRCTELCRALAYEVVLGWDDILTVGEKKGDVTEEESECAISGVISDLVEAH